MADWSVDVQYRDVDQGGPSQDIDAPSSTMVSSSARKGRTAVSAPRDTKSRRPCLASVQYLVGAVVDERAPAIISETKYLFH